MATGSIRIPAMMQHDPCAIATPSTSLSGSSPYAPMGPEGRASALTGRASGCEVRRAFPAIEAQSAIQPPGVFPHGPERSSIAPHRLPPPGARWRFLQSHFSARPSLAVLVQPRPSTCSPVSDTDSRLSLLPLHRPMMLSSSEPSPIFRTLDLSQSVSTRRTHLCWLLQSGPGYAPQRRFKARFRGLIRALNLCRVRFHAMSILILPHPGRESALALAFQPQPPEFEYVQRRWASSPRTK